MPEYRFPRIVVVSLADAHDRRDHMRAQFSRFPALQYEFFDAIRVGDRAAYPDDYDEHQRRLLFGDDLRPGEVGCFLSHRTLWQRCAESGDDAWCILEDDIALLDEFEARIRLLMAHREQWDVVRLMELIPRRGSWTHARLDADHVLRAYDRQPSGMQGYLIKPASARRVLEHSDRIVWPVDETLDLYWKHRQRLYTLQPAAIGLEPRFDSTIGVRSAKRRPKWRKVQRQLINGLHGAQRRWYNLRKHGLNRDAAANG